MYWVQVTKAEFHQRLLRAADGNPELFNQFRAAAAKKAAELNKGAPSGEGEKSLKQQKRRMSQDLKVALELEEVHSGASVELQVEVARLSAELEASQAVVIALQAEKPADDALDDKFEESMREAEMARMNAELEASQAMVVELQAEAEAALEAEAPCSACKQLRINLSSVKGELQWLVTERDTIAGDLSVLKEAKQVHRARFVVQMRATMHRNRWQHCGPSSPSVSSRSQRLKHRLRRRMQQS